MSLVYLDLDGTLCGPGGSIARGADGAFSAAGVLALGRLMAAEIPYVVVTGRSRIRADQSAHLIGATGALSELGALDAGYPTAPGQTVHAAIGATGIVAELLAREPRMEPHPAGAVGREGSHALRGRASQTAAAWVTERSAGALRLANNGRIRPDCHIYHLLPAAASKARSVALDVARRGVDPADCLMIGDSGEDMAIGQVVGTVALVANGAAADPSIVPRASFVTEASYGEGVLEAVERWLGSRPLAAVGSRSATDDRSAPDPRPAQR